jgi:hypothetical protein
MKIDLLRDKIRSKIGFLGVKKRRRWEEKIIIGSSN